MQFPSPVPWCLYSQLSDRNIRFFSVKIDLQALVDPWLFPPLPQRGKKIICALSFMVQGVSSSVKMILKLRQFCDLHLGGAEPSTGPLLMKKILNGGAHQATEIITGPRGIGEIGWMRNMAIPQILTVQSRIWLPIEWPWGWVFLVLWNLKKLKMREFS